MTNIRDEIYGIFKTFGRLGKKGRVLGDLEKESIKIGNLRDLANFKLASSTIALFNSVLCLGRILQGMAVEPELFLTVVTTSIDNFSVSGSWKYVFLDGQTTRLLELLLAAKKYTVNRRQKILNIIE